MLRKDYRVSSLSTVQAMVWLTSSSTWYSTVSMATSSQLRLTADQFVDTQITSVQLLLFMTSARTRFQGTAVFQEGTKLNCYLLKEVRIVDKSNFKIVMIFPTGA